MDELKMAVNNYLEREFGDGLEGNLAKVGIAYSTTEDGMHDIQWYADLKGLRLWLEIDGGFEYGSAFDTPEQMASYFQWASFSDFISDAECVIGALEEEV